MSAGGVSRQINNVPGMNPLPFCWNSLSQKCDSIEQGSGDISVSLVIHSGLLRENVFSLRGRALLS